MAENINMSFVPNKNASVESRLSDAEDALALLADRTEYCFGNLIEDGERTERTIEKSERTVNNLQRQVTVIVQNEGEDTGAVGKFVNDEKNSEIFNDYTGNSASGQYAHIEGKDNSGAAYATHVEGWLNSVAASCTYTHVEGTHHNIETCTSSHIEGVSNYDDGGGDVIHMEGQFNTTEGGSVNHLEGKYNHIKGTTNHIEGSDNDILNGASKCHAEGWKNNVTGNCNHAENEGNTVSGEDNHASGYDNRISGKYSAVFGQGNIVTHNHNAVFGKFNVDKDLAFCVGIGTAWTPPANRKNGLELDWNGNLTLTGRVFANAFDLYCSLVDENTVIPVPAGRKNVLIEVWRNPSDSGEAGFYDCCALTLPLSAESTVIYQSGDISVTCHADESGAVVLNSTLQGVKYKAMFYN